MTTQCPNCMGHGMRASGYCNRPGVDGRGVVYSNCAACEGTGALDWSELARKKFALGWCRIATQSRKLITNTAAENEESEEDELERYERWKATMEVFE